MNQFQRPIKWLERKKFFKNNSTKCKICIKKNSQSEKWIKNFEEKKTIAEQTEKNKSETPMLKQWNFQNENLKQKMNRIKNTFSMNCERKKLLLQRILRNYFFFKVCWCQMYMSDAYDQW